MSRTHQKVSRSSEAGPCLQPGGAADLVQRAVAAIEGRWKLAILFRLFEHPVLRFSELERDIDEVSQKMLAQHLRELERDGLIGRTVHAEVPPRVDYRLTAAGRGLHDALAALRDFGAEHLARQSDGDAEADRSAEGRGTVDQDGSGSSRPESARQ